MKVAFLLLTGGSVYRGAEHSMLMLAEDLVKLGHQVTVFQTGPKPDHAVYNVIQIKLPFTVTSYKPTTMLGKLLERLYLNRRGLATLLFSLKIFVINNLKFKIKNFNVILPTDGFWEVLFTKLFTRKSKIICVGLAGMGWTDRDTLKLNPDHFIALSPVAAEWAKLKNPKVPVSVIPLQVDVLKFQQASPSPLINLKSPIVLTVAALTPYKRIDLIIKAVNRLPHASLVIVGQGEALPALNRLAQELIPGRYQFLSVDFEKLPSIYRTATVFVLASESQEAFGQVLLEAMAANLPIVTTHDPIRRWIVGESGFYFTSPSEVNLSQLIQQSLKYKSPQYRLGRFERSEVARQYSNLILDLCQ